MNAEVCELEKIGVVINGVDENDNSVSGIALQKENKWEAERVCYFCGLGCNLDAEDRKMRIRGTGEFGKPKGPLQSVIVIQPSDQYKAKVDELRQHGQIREA